MTNLSFQGSDSSDTKVIPVRSLMWSKEIYGKLVQALDMKFSLFCVMVPLIKTLYLLTP